MGDDQIQNGESGAEGLASDLGLGRTSVWKWRFRHWLMKLRRKLPYLVWYGDEIDCRVTFGEHRLEHDAGYEGAMRAFFGGPMRDLEIAMHKAGISFDSGIGFHGRDWEWDFSLQGPISVSFKSRATKPERRRARPKPTLVVDNEPRPAA